MKTRILLLLSFFTIAYSCTIFIIEVPAERRKEDKVQDTGPWLFNPNKDPFEPDTMPLPYWDWGKSDTLPFPIKPTTSR